MLPPWDDDDDDDDYDGRSGEKLASREHLLLRRACDLLERTANLCFVCPLPGHDRVVSFECCVDCTAVVQKYLDMHGKEVQSTG